MDEDPGDDQTLHKPCQSSKCQVIQLPDFKRGVPPKQQQHMVEAGDDELEDEASTDLFTTPHTPDNRNLVRAIPSMLIYDIYSSFF